MVSRCHLEASRLPCNGPVLKESSRHAPRRGPRPVPRASAQGCDRPERGEWERGPRPSRGGSLLCSHATRRSLGSSLTASEARRAKGQREECGINSNAKLRELLTPRAAVHGGPRPRTSGDSGLPRPPAPLQDDGKTPAGSRWGPGGSTCHPYLAGAGSGQGGGAPCEEVASRDCPRHPYCKVGACRWAEGHREGASRDMADTDSRKTTSSSFICQNTCYLWGMNFFL